MATLPSVFYAYPSQPLDLTETVEAAIYELTQTNVADIRSWRTLSISGPLAVGNFAVGFQLSIAFPTVNSQSTSR